MKREQNQGSGISIETYLSKMDLLDVKLEQLDRKLSNKADEVVNIQLFQHRRDLEELYETVMNMEMHLKKIDEELSQLSNESPAQMSAVTSKRRGRKVTPLFT